MSDAITGPEGAGIKSVHVIAADAWHAAAFPDRPILFAAWIWVAYTRPGHPPVHDTADPILVAPRSRDWTFQHPDSFAGKPGQVLNIRFESRWASYLPGQPFPPSPSEAGWEKIDDTILTADQTRIEFFTGHNPQKTVDLQIDITWDKPF